jgi:adenylosuccinate lyase
MDDPQQPRSFGFDDYLSPFTWRYGSQQMRRLWGEDYKRRLWRRIWVALARAQQHHGLVTAAQVADLALHQDDIDLGRAHDIEREIQHDMMAEVRAFAEQCPVGGGIIHLGATSMDVQDNADALRLRESLDIVLAHVDELLLALAATVERQADQPSMAFTHLQPAEPTTIGYRLAQYAQDLLEDRTSLHAVRDRIRGKGFKGAVGTAASYVQLLGDPDAATDLEARVMAALGITAFPVATQTYPRKQDYDVLAALAGLGQSLYKLSFDLRLLQSPVFGELAEPFGERQVGSSAMPFKRNPINAENVCSLARHLAALPRVAWDNAAHSLLERTLDDSANRRSVLPEAFLIADEITRRTLRVVLGLRIDPMAARRLLERYGAFAATERLLMEATKRGGDRQALHEVIREHSLAAWAAVQAGAANPLVDRLLGDTRITALVPVEEARRLLDAEDYVGRAPGAARTLARAVRAAVAGRPAAGPAAATGADRSAGADRPKGNP